MFCYFVCAMLDMMVLARRVGAEMQLQRVTAGWWNQLIDKQWTAQFWSYVLNSEVSTNDVCRSTSRLCHVWLCDVASPIPSWHRLRRGGVTFGRLAVEHCWPVPGNSWYGLIVLTCLLTVIVYFVEGSRTFMVFQNLCESSIRCNISVLALVCSGLEFSRCKRSI